MDSLLESGLEFWLVLSLVLVGFSVGTFALEGVLRQRLFTVLVVTVFEYRRLGKLKLENFVMIE